MAQNPYSSLIESMMKLSQTLVPALVAEGRRIGKNPFCIDGMSEMMAHDILGWWYRQETHQEYEQRHYEECGHCTWCQARRWEHVE